eukprot:tig00000754_g3916.t1
MAAPSRRAAFSGPAAPSARFPSALGVIPTATGAVSSGAARTSYSRSNVGPPRARSTPPRQYAVGESARSRSRGFGPAAAPSRRAAFSWSAGALFGGALPRGGSSSLAREVGALLPIGGGCGPVEASLLEPVVRFFTAIYQFLQRVYVTLWGALAHTPASPDQRVDPRELGDPDSRFADLLGLSVHYKEAAPPSEPGAPLRVLLLHGFGASQFSWHLVLQSIAEAFGGRAAAFDRPAFGLTSRPLPDGRGRLACGKAHGEPCTRGCPAGYCKLYGYPFAGELTAALIDELGEGGGPVVLVGHSAGGLLAAQVAIRYPERVAGLVLVAPAIFTGIGGPKVPGAVPANEGAVPNALEPYPTPPFFSVAYATAAAARARTAARRAWNQVRAWARVLARALGALWRAAVLRFIRSRLFVWFIRGVTQRNGPKGVAAAFFDRSKCTPETIAGYTRPFKAWDWDVALAELVAATLGGGFWGPPADDGASPATIWERLSRIQVPTCVITGDKDTFVPASNAGRVAGGIAGAELHVLPNCGHLPHEECPEETMRIVRAFAERLRSPGR